MSLYIYITHFQCKDAKVEGGGTACSRYGWSGGTDYLVTDGPGGPFIPIINGPGGPMAASSMTGLTNQ